jgi:hypothetical protein
MWSVERDAVVIVNPGKIRQLEVSGGRWGLAADVFHQVSIGAYVTGANTMVNSRGVHGLTCSVSSSATSEAAITIYGPSNTLEDISISGSSSQDGALIHVRVIDGTGKPPLPRIKAL